MMKGAATVLLVKVLRRPAGIPCSTQTEGQRNQRNENVKGRHGVTFRLRLPKI